MRLRYAALSDVGRVRRDNQDSGYAGPHLLVIADGVGGSARGDIASAAAVEVLRRLDEPPGNDMLGGLAGAIHRTHDRIASQVAENPEIEGTSTTVTAIIFDGTHIGVGHVGDSRGYLLRDGTLSQLTTDHSFVQSLIDEGRITEDEARVHPHRNLILRAVDGVHEPEPDVFTLEVAGGDRILLCSDGCSGSLTNDELARILGEGTPDHSAVSLIAASLDAGSSDNVTVVVADVVEDDAVDDAETTASAVTGPMLVGAAAEAPRKRGVGRTGRTADTGELEPVKDAQGVEEGVDPEEMRYAPRPPRRFTWARRIAVLAVVVLLAAIVAVASWTWSQTQYYVANDGDSVVIFQGVEADVPGINTHHVKETSDLVLDDLPDYNARQVRDGISATSLDDARGIVSRLQRLVPCPEPTTPTPSATPSKLPTKKSTKPTRQPRPAAHPAAHPVPECELQCLALTGHRPVRRGAMSTGHADAPAGLMGFVHRRRRGAELVLLLLSLVVGIGAYAAVGLGVDGTLPVDLFTYGAWLAGLVIACHVAIRIFAAYADPILLPIVSALNGLGLAMIHRIDLANEAKDSAATCVRRHPAHVDDDRRGHLHRRARRAARPPPAAGLHLHRRPGRDRAAPAAAAARHRPPHQRCPHLDPPRPDELPAR